MTENTKTERGIQLRDEVVERIRTAIAGRWPVAVNFDTIPDSRTPEERAVYINNPEHNPYLAN